MSPARYAEDEIVRRGEEIYEREIRARVEPDHRGEFLAIDVETGDYVTDIEKMSRALVSSKNGLPRHFANTINTPVLRIRFHRSE